MADGVPRMAGWEYRHLQFRCETIRCPARSKISGIKVETWLDARSGTPACRQGSQPPVAIPEMRYVDIEIPDVV